MAVSRQHVRKVMASVLEKYVNRAPNNETRADLANALDITVDSLPLADSHVTVDLRPLANRLEIFGQVSYSINPESNRMERINFHLSDRQYFIED